MGKQVKSWTPPQEDLVATDTVEKTPSWTPPADDAVVEPVKKKDESVLPSSSASSEPVKPSSPSSESSTPSNKWEAFGQALDVVAPGSRMLYDFGRRVISGVADDIPKATAQALEVAKSSVSPANVQEFIKTQRPIDFQKYVREKEGLKWYQAFEEDKYLAKYADSFMRDTGLQEISDRITENAPQVIDRRLAVEKYVAQQKQESAEKMAGAVQDYRDINNLSDVGSYVGTLGGQAAYQIPLAIASRGTSSLIQESATIYDQQIDNIAAERKISREEVIKQNLDDPAKDQAYALLAAGLDAFSAGNILKVLRQGAGDGLLKRWIKSTVPEALTEPAQGVIEEVGAATGDKVEAAARAIKDPNRINEVLGGMIGGSAGVFGASPAQTVEVLSENIDPTNTENLSAKAELIQAKVEQHQGDVTAGHIDKQQTTPITDAQETEVAPPAIEGTTEAVIPETQTQAETEVQGDQEVATQEVTSAAPQETIDPNQPTTKYLDQDSNAIQPDVVQTGTSEESAVDQETAINDTNENIGGRIQTTNDWLNAVIRNDTEAINNATNQLIRQTEKERGILADNDRGGISVRTSRGDGENFGQEVDEEGARTSQESQPIGQQSGESGGDDALTTLQSSQQGEISQKEESASRLNAAERRTVEQKVQELSDLQDSGKKASSARSLQQLLEQTLQQNPKKAKDLVNIVVEKLQSSSGPPAPPSVPTEQAPGEQLPKTPKERTVYARIKNDPDISETIKQGIATEAKQYVPRSLKRVTSKEADAIIDAKGLDESIKMYLDDNQRLYPDVDTAIGIKLFDRLQTEDNFTDAIRVFEKLSVRGTELGQAVNAYKLMQGKTMLNVVNKSIQKARQKYKEKNESRFIETKSTIDKINRDAVEKVLKSPRIKKAVASEVKKGNVKKAIDFLEGLKVDTKGKALDVVYGISASAWNTIITAVQKGLQAGLTISQAINKAVAKEKSTDFQRQEAINYLDEQLKDYRVTLDPAKAIKAELAASDQRIDDIVREHYTTVASTKKSLIDKLIKDGNVPADQAQAIADELGAEFDRLTRAAKERALQRLLPKPSKNIAKKERKDTIDQLIEQSNIGALSEEQYSDIISEKLGVPKLTEQQLKEVQDLTDKVQKAKGETAKSKAAQDLLNYVENLKGWNWLEATQAIWYANILSGPTTWMITNPVANLTNLISEASIDIAQNPADAKFILQRMTIGLTRGLLQAKDVLKTGYSPYKGEDYKTEAKPLLERIEFKGGNVNPLNWLKYVTRAIKAGDILFYHPLKEQRLATLALMEARKNGRTSPSKDDMHNLREQLIKEDYDTALEQAFTEGFSGREQKIRAFEILENMRPEYATKEAESFAARATFNIKPEGTLGKVAEGLNKFRRDVPALNYVVPFVNTIMNVANEYMNYNPVFGFTRVIKGSYGWNSDAKTYRKLTNEERARIAIKATIGSLAMMSLYLLDDPEDEDNLVEITANGYGDRLKNYELERSGWRPYSIRIGDKWFSYKNTPLGFPMATIGFMKDAQRYRKKPSLKEELDIAFMGSVRFMMDMSTLSGLSDFFEMFSKENIGEYSSAAGKFFSYAEKTVKSVIIPNYFTQISRLFQEFTDSPIKRAQELGESVYRDIPVLRDNLDNLYDAFGDPVVPKQLEKFIPLNVHRTPEDVAMFDFLREKKLVVGVPSRENLKMNGTPMTEAEYREWSVAAAKRIKSRLKREYKMYRTEKNREVIQRWFDDIKREERLTAKEIVFGF